MSAALEASAKRCIVILGNFLKDQFQKGTTFITRMKTLPIMILKILSALQEKNMTADMPLQVGLYGRQKKEAKVHQHLGKIENPGLLFVNNATMNIKQQDKLQNFALGNAEEFPIVVAIEQSSPTKVWDLTVDGPPEFFADGILVHNCSWEPLSNPPMPSPDRLDAVVWGLTDLMLGPDGIPTFGTY
jgi:hypothetical protein